MRYEYPIRILSLLEASGKLPHALIFTGTHKDDKISISFSFAKWIMGKSDKSEETHSMEFPDFISARCECRSCNLIVQLSHPDLLVIKSSPITIKEVRELKSRFSLAPFFSKVKIGLVLNAESLNLESANAFLKFLEEPKGNTMIMLLAKTRSSVLATIASRSMEIRFSGESANVEDLYSKPEIDKNSRSVAILENGTIHEKFTLAKNFDLKNKSELVTILDLWLLNLRKGLVAGSDLGNLELMRKIMKARRVILTTNASPQLLLEELALNPERI